MWRLDKMLPLKNTESKKLSHGGIVMGGGAKSYLVASKSYLVAAKSNLFTAKNYLAADKSSLVAV